MLPRKFVTELHNVPATNLYPIAAIVQVGSTNPENLWCVLTQQDLVGDYTGMDVLLGSHLSHTAVMTRLNPKIAHFTRVVEDELNLTLDTDFPQCNGKICAYGTELE